MLPLVHSHQDSAPEVPNNLSVFVAQRQGCKESAKHQIQRDTHRPSIPSVQHFSLIPVIGYLEIRRIHRVPCVEATGRILVQIHVP